MNRNARNRFVAWLGIAAMWLAIVVPVISQSVAAAPEAALCAVDASHSDKTHHDAAGHLDACGYCSLLAHDLPLVSTAELNVARVERVTRAVSVATVDAPVPKSFNAASPRAPPVLS